MLKTITKTIVIILFMTGCSGYESTYQAIPLKIDGSSSDWTTTLDSKNNNSFSYGISNDNENLYIRINIIDPLIQRKMILAGLTVWIDTTGKKKENLGITCPIQKIQSSKMKRDSKAPPIWDKNQILDAEFIGFEKRIESFYISNNPYKIEVAIDQDNFKSLYYEMKIPFYSIFSSYTDLRLKTLSIGIETGALKMPSQGINNHPIGMTGGGKSSTGGRGGGGRGGGRGGAPNGMSGSKMGGTSGSLPNNSSMTDLTKPTKVWINNIELAKQ